MKDDIKYFDVSGTNISGVAFNALYRLRPDCDHLEFFCPIDAVTGKTNTWIRSMFTKNRYYDRIESLGDTFKEISEDEAILEML